MLDNFLTVAQQVIILFILIGIGFFCGKAKLFSRDGIKNLTSLVLYVVTPCVIIGSFNREFDKSMLTGLLITALVAILTHIGSAVLANLIIKDKDKARECTLRFATVFSNCGFMSLPLQQALLGSTGVFYGAVYVAVFNLFVWSYGLATMSGSFKELTLKKIFINPGIIGIAIGLPLFLLSVKLPVVVSSPINYIASLNTPVPMLIIGFQLASANIREALKDAKSYLVIALRLLAIPIIALGIMYLCGIRGDVLVSCVIGASAPVAATTTIFALKFDRDVELSVNTVSLSTVISIITMPLIVGFAQFIS